MNSSGLLRVGSDTLLSWGVVLHCAEEVVVGDQVVVAEHATIVDSVHPRTAPGVNFRHHVRAAPTHIGSGVWIAAGAIVASGVKIGDQAVVGAGSVVTKDVPGGWLVAGSPARPVRQLATEET